MLNLAGLFVVVVLECFVLGSNSKTLFATLSISVPSSNIVPPSQVFNENNAPLCFQSKSL